jgi:phenylacetic acid degradation protein paaN
LSGRPEHDPGALREASGAARAAVEACRSRAFWSAFPEAPSGRIYGDTANADGRAAFEARLGRPFALEQPTTGGHVGEEASPYGIRLGIPYPTPDVDGMLEAAQAAMPAWRGAGIEARTGVCLEILERLNRRSFELAHAVVHTTGQGFVMAFQAGGPHAQDRGLEALAYAYAAMTRTAGEAFWEKPVGKDQLERFQKSFTVMPRGVGLVIGCATFPTWNSYPAIIADLACGNAVVVKPHPKAVLPLAITVEVAQAALREAGHDPRLVMLAVDTPAAPIAKDLALRPEVRLIDFTGSTAMGEWLEDNARQALVFTEKAGVNPVVFHSTASLEGMARNLAMSLALYSGQMCTTPQNILVPAAGIDSDGGRKGLDEVAAAITGAVDRLLADPERAQAEAGNHVLRASTALTHPKFPEARVRSPLLLRAEAADEPLLTQEWFGPIAFFVACADVEQAIALAKKGVREHGAITAAVYSTDETVLERMREAMLAACVALSENLTGATTVNQSEAFSDYHVTGANPAGNACLTDEAFVAGRFRIVQSRRPVLA